MPSWFLKQIDPSRSFARFARLTSPLWSAPVFLLLLFFGAMFWAKEQDPFSRKWFAVKLAGRNSLECVAVLPKPIRRCPVVIYAHSSRMANSQRLTVQESPVELAFAGSIPRNSTIRLRYGSEGWLLSFSHFSMVASETPRFRNLESWGMERDRSIRFLRRCSPKVLGWVG